MSYIVEEKFYNIELDWGFIKRKSSFHTLNYFYELDLCGLCKIKLPYYIEFLK